MKIISNKNNFIENKSTIFNNIENIIRHKNSVIISEKMKGIKYYIFPSKSYTRYNLLLSVIATIYNKPFLYSICYSNSVAILFSFQSTLIIAPQAYSNLVNIYNSNYKFWTLNILSHYLPVGLFYNSIGKNDITLKTVTISCLLHLLWGKLIKWDLNKIYQINPPLDQTMRYKLWSIAIMSHYLVYFISRTNYIWIFHRILSI